jgi:thiol-disulfide isomerase/thioredoxin
MSEPSALPPPELPSRSKGDGTERKKAPILAIAFLLMFPALLCGVAIYQRVRGVMTTDGVRAAQNRSDYTLDMPTLDGGRWKTSDRVGKVLVINEFATWCAPCREEMPELAKIATDYASRGVEIAAIGLDLDGETSVGRVATLKQYADLEQLPFPVLLPPPALTRAEMIPRTYLIDRHGHKAFFMLGPVDDQRMRAMLDALLKEQ